MIVFRNKIAILISASIILWTLFYCTGDLKNNKIDWDLNPELGLPLINAGISFADGFLPKQDSSIYIYPDNKGMLHLCFSDTLKVLTTEMIISSEVNKKLPYKDTLVLPKGKKGLTITSPATYFSIYLDSILDQNQLDTLLLSKGIIEVYFDTWQNYDCNFSITFSNITNANGKNICIQDFSPKAGNNRLIIDLKDTRLKINTSETTKGIFTIILAYSITTKSSSATLPPPAIYLTIQDFEIRSVYGKLYNLPIKEKINFKDSLFKSLQFEVNEMNLDIADPVIRFKFLNQVGLPFRIDSIRFGVIKSSEYMGITGIQSSVYFPAPAFLNKSEFIPVTLTIEPSSNIEVLFSKFPEEWSFNGSVTLNPYESTRYSFIRDQDSLIIKAEGDIPLNFSLFRVTLKAKTDINLNSLAKIENKVENVKLQAKIKNSFPFELKYQGYLADDNLKIVDSLFQEPVLIKAASGSQSETETLFYVDKNVNQIKKLKECTKIISHAKFFTTSGNTSTLTNFNALQSISIDVILFTRLNL